MKIELIQNLSGSKSYPIGEEFDTDIDISIEQAVRYVEKGIAKPINIEEYQEQKAKLEAKKTAQDEAEIKAYALVQQDKIKETVRQLDKELKTTLELVEDDEFRAEFGFVTGEVFADEELERLKDTEETYKNLIIDLSVCTKIAEFRAVVKKYTEEQ